MVGICQECMLLKKKERRKVDNEKKKKIQRQKMSVNKFCFWNIINIILTQTKTCLFFVLIKSNFTASTD